jgi:hypothetical protein
MDHEEVLMLTVLLSYAVLTPTQLPLPTRLDGLPQPTPFRKGLDTRLDTAFNTVRSSDTETNYERWSASGREWHSARYNEVKLPTQARPLPRNNVCPPLIPTPHPCRPWDFVYQQRAGFGFSQDTTHEGFVGYRLIELPNRPLNEYFALVEHMPMHIVRARSIEELERKIVHDFTSYVERLTILRDAYPPLRISSGKLDGAVEGLSFAF